MKAVDPIPAEVAPPPTVPDTYQQVVGEMPEGLVDVRQETNSLIRIKSAVLLNEGAQAEPEPPWLIRFTAYTLEAQLLFFNLPIP